MPKSELLPSLSAPLLFFKEGQEKFTLVTLYKKVTVSESLPRSLQKSDCDGFALFQQRIAISLFRSQKNKRFIFYTFTFYTVHFLKFKIYYVLWGG